MARPKKLKPDYCRDKSSDRAFVTLNGKRKYLGSPGSYGSQASRDEYDRLIGEWVAAGRLVVPADHDHAGGITIEEIIDAFWTHATSYYASCVRPDGKVTGELDCYRHALKPLRRLYGTKPAAEFGPLALKSLRDEMIKLGWCRNVINRQILRIKSVFKWAVGNESLPANVYEALRAVAGLRSGKTTARETDAVKPVAEDHATAIFDHLSPQVQAMIELQALTGMRPGEACIMRGCDIDTTGKPWKYRPSAHKTAHRGHDRVIDLGPQARAIVEKFLKTDMKAYLFQPAEAAESRRQVRSEARTTPTSCGNRRRRRCDQPYRERYDVATYRRAIKRACAEAFPPPEHLARLRVPAMGRKKKATRWESTAEWRKRLGAEAWAELRAWQKANYFHPHQLRHAAATRWRREFGAEATLTMLGDRTTRMVDIYAEKDRATASRIAEKIG